MKHSNDSASTAPRRLYLIGALTACVYLLTFLFYRKGPQSHGRTAKEIFAWFICLSLLLLFWSGHKLVSKSTVGSASSFEISPRLVASLGALLCVLACLIFPFHSTDVFGYINRGWQQVHYHQNPYVYFVADIPQWQHDPMIWDHWIYNPNPYGFLFTLLTRLFCDLGNGHWALTLALFKAVNALAYGFASWLIWAGAKHLGQSKPIVTLYLFMWNPLILMHEIANGHNDILTGSFVLLALYLGVVGAGLWIIPALVVATLLKYGPAILIPFALIFVIKNHGWKVATFSCLIGVAILGLASAPYIADWRMFRLEDIASNATLIDNSLHSFLIHIFENIARLIHPLSAWHHTVDWLIKNALRAGFALFLIAQLIAIPKYFSPNLLARKSSLIMFVLICVVSSKFNAWYLGMVLPLALLLDEDDWLRRLVVLISCAQLLSLTFFKQAYILNFFVMMLVPAWLVFGVILRAADMAHLEEVQAASGVSMLSAGFETVDTDAIIGSFARHLMTAFDRWNERGFDAIARDYLERLPKHKAGERRAIDLNGDLLVRLPAAGGPPERSGLVDALAKADWYDARSRGPKLG